jgi:hypothetical protein
MGILVVVENERGTQIASLEDPTNILHRVLPALDDPGFQFLNYVDWYGDTTFNRYQVPGVRKELKRLSGELGNIFEQNFLKQLDVLAERAESRVHLYLKFYGD